YLKTKSTVEAVFVYETIVYNGFSNRLGYKDHHNLFRLALVDVAKYRKVIIKIRHQLAENGFVPTEYFLNEYIVCCAKWGDIDVALKSLQECLNEGLCVSTTTWEELLSFYLSGPDRQAWKDGVRLWKKLKSQIPVVRPSASIYLKTMQLYSKLGDGEGTAQVYAEAEDNLERLLQTQLDRSGSIDSQGWKADMHTQLFNAYLGSFKDPVLLEKALQEYQDFFDSGTLQNTKSAANTYSILFRLLSRLDNPHLQGIYAAKLWQDMEHAAVTPDYLHYSRMMAFQSDADELRRIYRSATSTLRIGLASSKRQALDSSFLTSLSRHSSIEAFAALREHRDTPGLRKPLRLVYVQLSERLRDAGYAGEAQQVETWLQVDQTHN
ncbi:hypothetical protein HDU91_004977, partial [Kappamyces sp. JEL0680]